MDLRDDSPLDDWNNREPESYEDSTHQWFKESEKYTIKISDYDKFYQITLDVEYKTKNGNKITNLKVENEKDIESAITKAEEFARKYKNIEQKVIG